MTIIISNHIFFDFYSSPARTNGALLDYLSELIRKEHNILLLDLHEGNKKNTVFDKIPIHIGEHTKTDGTGYSFFKKYYQFGKLDKIYKLANHGGIPDIILISSFAFCYFDGFKKTVDAFRSVFPDAFIIAGGGGPSSAPDYYLQNSAIDLVVQGAAEQILSQIVSSLPSEREQLRGRIITNNIENYEFNPFIAYNKNIERIQLQLTRGCPLKCTYCSISLTAGKNFLKTDSNKIVSYIDKYVEGRIKHIAFEDDNLTCDKEYLYKTITIIKKKYPDCTISFENGIDFRTLDDAVIEFLQKNNISQWNLSLSSANNSTLNKLGRFYRLDNFEETLDKVIKTGKTVIVYFISGLPGDTVENILKTIFFLSQKCLLLGISNFYPVPNTEIVDKYGIYDIIPDNAKGSSFMQYGECSSKELITFFMISRFVNSIKEQRLNDILKPHDLIESGKSTVVINDRNKVTITGIVISIRMKKIVSLVKKSSDEYIISPYNLDSFIIDKFFDFIYNEYIVNLYNEKIYGRMIKVL